MDVARKVYWLTTAMLLNPPQYESVLWRYVVGKSWVRANHLCAFSLMTAFTVSVTTPLFRLAHWANSSNCSAPMPNWGRRYRGIVTARMRRGESIQGNHYPSRHAGDRRRGGAEIERLLELPSLSELKHALESARHQLRLMQREGAFRFPPLASVAEF